MAKKIMINVTRFVMTLMAFDSLGI